jgi:hypothetical protein
LAPENPMPANFGNGKVPTIHFNSLYILVRIADIVAIRGPEADCWAREVVFSSMSSRQKQRLQQQLLQEQLKRADKGKATVTAAVQAEEDSDESADDNDNDNEGEVVAGTVAAPPKKSVFAMMADDDDSDSCSSSSSGHHDDSDGETQTKSKPQQQQQSNKSSKNSKKNSKKNAKKKSLQRYDESVEALARSIEGAAVGNSNNNTSSASADTAISAYAGSALVRNKLFEIDEKNLDVDKVMKKRFGARVLAGDGDDNEGGHHGPGRRHLRIPANRRLLFGLPKDDWSKAPTIAGGGYSFIRTDSIPAYYAAAESVLGSKAPAGSWFHLEWSEEYYRVHHSYELVQNTGDANQLVVFLSQYPYHLDGLLQLAMVFARTGQMDRASDLVRRCLFCLEISFCDTFRPTKGEGHRVDPTLQQNSALFTALFRHMQLTNMLGCPGVATDIGIFLYALCPEGDPMHTLLLVDHFMVCAGRFDQLLAWTGAASDADSDMWSLDRIVAALENSNMCGCGYWSSTIEIGLSPFSLAALDPANASASSSSTSSRTSSAQPSLGLWCLPNWWFSLALAAFNEEFKQSRNAEYGGSVKMPGGGGSSCLSSAILQCALLQWPFILQQLVSSKKSGLEGKSLNWRTVLGCPFFSKAASR